MGKRNKLVRRLLTLTLSLAMVATSINLPAITVAAAEEDAEVPAKKYINFNYIEKDDFTDAVDVTVDYQGTKATITGSDWGSDWGGDSKYQIQLKELVPVTPGENYTVSFTMTTEVERDVFIKLGDHDVDATSFKEEIVHLNAGENEVTLTTDKAVDIEQLMVLFALGDQDGAHQNTITISNFAVEGETSGYADTTPYINFNNIDKDDFTDAVDVTVDYQGTKATITGSDWGSDWGGDSKYQIQLKELVPVTPGENYTVSFTMTTEVERDVFIKLGDHDVDATSFKEEIVHLNAGENEVTLTTDKAVDIEQLMVLFALGDQDGAHQNTITISKLALVGESSGYVVVKPQTDKKGPEYDFAAEDNADHDYADPGKTKEGYDLIWADEFDGNYGDAQVDENGLNLNNWAYQLGDGTTDCSNPGWGNNELEAYTANKKNLGVNEDLNQDGQGDGLLRITASYEKDGYTYESETKKNYTSARIRTTKPTEELFTTTYGYIEGRMSLPATKGAWPAFWMLPQSTTIYGGWPVSGEIDIMETNGSYQDQACGTLHWGGPDHVYKGSGYVKTGNSAYNYFHTYAVDWEPGKITWYYDGQAINTLSNWASGFAGASDKLSFDAPFDQPFYMLLNLAVDSGQFGGAGNKAKFQDDINMYVDYVRVYQKTAGYEKSAVASSSGDIKDDWKDYEGQNQIGEITEGCIELNMPEEASSDPAKWYASTNANGTGGAADVSIVKDSEGKEWAKVAITDKGSQDYSVQMIGHYNAKAGYLYEVSFDAYAEGNMIGQTVNCDSKEWAGWSIYGIQSFALGDKPQHISYLVDQSEDFDDCRIEFNLGAHDVGTVYIGNVRVEIVDPALISREQSRAPLSDGNLIYNSTFDQGLHHKGYWNAAEGTTFEVPRYTTEALAEGDVSVVDVASKTNYEKIADGVKYYERRAQVSAKAGTKPQIYQTDLTMPADSYVLSFDLYSKAETEVTASIYNVITDGDEKTLGSELLSTTAQYTDANKVVPYKWTFETKKPVENAALVLTFADGASVQIDNVVLIGDSLAEKVDETPVNADTVWSANDAGDANASITYNKGENVVTNITSGGSWYMPQFTSDTFRLVAGNNYKISFKYKMSGTSNNTFEYIVQEQNGSWTVFQDITKVTYDPDQADEDGFCSYELTFKANTTLPNVALNFGFGNSEADQATFEFKDIAMTLVADDQQEPGGSSNTVTMPETPTITTQPADGTYTQGAAAAALTVAASVSGGTLSYQWYSGASEATAAPIQGATGASYVPSTTEAGTTYYYCVVTNTLSSESNQTASVQSSAAKIVVNAAPNPTPNPTVTKKDNTLAVAAPAITKTYGSKAFNLSITGAVGAVTYASSKTAVATVGADGKVTLKGAGKTVITVKAAGDASTNEGVKTITLTVKPAKVTLKSAKSTKSKTLTVRWKKDKSKATGYQIQYGTSRKFKGAKMVTVKKIKTLKTTIKKKLKGGKKYYVRIRAYKTDGGKIYGAWSKAKNVKVKK